MLHGLRAKGSTAALINSENPMWPVAEFSSVRYCVYSPARPERAVAAELGQFVMIASWLTNTEMHGQ